MLQYLIKFSISLVVLFVFYIAVLRPLTFYTWNRFYLLCYSLCSFVMPFINITPWITKQGAENNELTNLIPAITNYDGVSSHAGLRSTSPSLLSSLHASQWLLLLFFTGAAIMLARVLIQYWSLRLIRRKSVSLHSDGRVQLFQTTATVTPFSFGNAIYFNNKLHSDEELQRIIQHEFVHVKQKHSIDILIGELLCVVNWFNPFAWLIRHAIRQNLEFIADNAVVENGVDKKEYQYLLLKVVGISQYSIANNFNFSSLKKRIAMMNKMKSAKLHLGKFLFVLPLLAVLLLAFRNVANLDTDVSNLHRFKKAGTNNNLLSNDTLPQPVQLPPPPPPAAKAVSDVINEKGYIISITDNRGERVVVVRDKSKKIIRTMPLTEWDNNKKENEQNFGKLVIPPPPPPAQAKQIPAQPDKISNLQHVQVDTNKVAPDSPSIVDASEQPVQRPIHNIRITQTGTPLNNQPLYVIDGIVQSNDYTLNALEPNMISSITVLKDKDVTAVYGERAVNGAVLITTKKHLLLSGKDGVGNRSATPAVIQKTGTIKPNDTIPQVIEKPIPPNVLVMIDDKEMPAGTRVEDVVKPSDIELIHVYNGKEAIERFGDKGKNNAIEITTKKYRAEKK